MGVFLGAAVAFAMSCSGSEKAACGPTTCDGCCDTSGQCVSGASASNCGSGGATCDVCSASESCSAGSCVASEPEDDAGVEQDAGTDAGSDAGTDPTKFADFAAYDTARADAICQLAVKCGVFASADACKSSGYLTDEYQIGLQPGAEAAAIKDGRATFDGAQARACVDGIAAAECSGFSGALTSTACQAAVQGAVAEGGSCFADLECAAADYCSSNSQTCPDKCLARKGEGELANDPEECQAGLYLDLNGACAAKVAVGQSCAGGSAFDPPKECVDGAWCNADRVCQAKGGTGTTCDDDRACLAPYVCRSGECAERGALGASCSQSPTAPCQLDLACDATGWDQAGSCTAPKTEGGSCYESSQCATGLFCRGTPSPDHCAAPNALGESCQPYVDGECAADAYCSSSSQTCKAKIAAGQPCTEQGSCAGESFCDGSTCVARICTDPTP